MTDLDTMLVPSLCKKSQLAVDGLKKEMVKKPYVVDIIDVETMSKLQGGKELSPICSNLCSNINPETFNPNVMYTPESNISWGLYIWFSIYLPQM